MQPGATVSWTSEKSLFQICYFGWKLKQNGGNPGIHQNKFPQSFLDFWQCFQHALAEPLCSKISRPCTGRMYFGGTVLGPIIPKDWCKDNRWNGACFRLFPRNQLRTATLGKKGQKIGAIHSPRIFSTWIYRENRPITSFIFALKLAQLWGLVRIFEPKLLEKAPYECIRCFQLLVAIILKQFIRAHVPWRTELQKATQHEKRTSIATSWIAFLCCTSSKSPWASPKECSQDPEKLVEFSLFPFLVNIFIFSAIRLFSFSGRKRPTRSTSLEIASQQQLDFKFSATGLTHGLGFLCPIFTATIIGRAKMVLCSKST